MSTSVRPKFVELTADVLEIFSSNTTNARNLSHPIIPLPWKRVYTQAPASCQGHVRSYDMYQVPRVMYILLEVGALPVSYFLSLYAVRFVELCTSPLLSFHSNTVRYVRRFSCSPNPHSTAFIFVARIRVVYGRLIDCGFFGREGDVCNVPGTRSPAIRSRTAACRRQQCYGTDDRLRETAGLRQQ